MENDINIYTYPGEKLGKTNDVRIKKIYRINGGQDGAVYGNYLFRFDAVGNCGVYDLKTGGKLSSFRAGSVEKLKIHSNAVCFGKEYFEEGDEFPLLYSNVYNSYQACEERLEGHLGVYRLTRDGVTFSASLVQVIRVGFTEDLSLWKSLPGNGDVRPYGNFTVDAENGILWAFTMRDKEKVTRFFSFPLPKKSDGVFDERFGCNVVTLEKGAMITDFDAPYSNFLQGACFDNGLIYSTEGFSNTPSAPAVMRVIDVNAKKQAAVLTFREWGMTIEPEFIYVCDGNIYYSDAVGDVFTFEFI